MSMKKCTQCQQEKELLNFSKKSKSPDGLSSWCKECTKAKGKVYYNKNKDSIKKRAENYYYSHYDERKEYREENKEERSEYNKLYKQEHREEISEYNRVYKEEHKGKIKIQRKGYRKENRVSINDYTRLKLKTDPMFKMCKTVRNRLYDFLQTKNLKKKYKFEEYIGCTPSEFKIHIESQFQPGMTWDNHGTLWHIDHIIALANAQNEEQIYKLCHYKNLRPLVAHPNFIKGDRADMCWQKLQRDKLLDEDIKLGFPINLEPKDFVLSHEEFTTEHRSFIERYEWLGTIGFGVRHVFTARWENKLAGVVMIAEPNNYQFNKEHEALIQRGACASWTPKNLGSMLVMFSCNWMVRNTEKRIFTAYSDSTAGEIGTIYQACNFDFIGNTFGAKNMLVTPEGKKVNSRYFTRTSSMRRWAKELGIKWESSWTKENGFQNLKAIPEDILNKLKQYAKNKLNECERIKVRPKGKYALLLNYGKEKVKKTWESLPYPKRIIV